MTPLLSFAFFLSGFSGLLCQTVWQRMLAPFAGSDVLSATLVVASFMGGLGAGSLAGGRLASRWSWQGQLTAFSIVEAGVAACALASTAVLYDGLFLHAGTWSEALWVRALVVGVVLLPPTLLMGMSLPLLSAAAAAGSTDPARVIGGLYGWNTVGAAAGALATVWLIFRITDQRTALAIGAGLTLGAAAIALAVRTWPPGAPRSRPPVPEPHSPERPAPSLPLGAWIALFALSGFVALSLEILWFRVLGVVVKSSATTFGTLLAIYLMGIGSGALLGRRRLGQPSAPVLLFWMAAVPCFAGVALAVLQAWTDGDSVLAAHVARYDPWDLSSVGLSEFLYVHLLVPVVLIGPSTFGMGVTFVWLQRAAQTDPAHVGLRVGYLQAANLTGAVLGAALTGLLLLDWLGTTGVMRALVASAVVPVGLGLRLLGPGGRARAVGALALLAVGAAVWVVPDRHSFWRSLHGAARLGFFVDEDRTGVVAVRDEPHAGKIVFTNGLGQSRLPYGGIHVALGAVPSLAHPNPRQILIIGLGSGATLFGAAGRPDTERLELVELVRPQRELLQRIRAEYAYPALARVLDDPRVTWHSGDGRAFLQQTSARYDVIEADALRPTSPYAGLLYSREYFSLVRARLAPGGLAVSWNPTPRVGATFSAVFPHVAQAGDLLLGSNDPIHLDPAALRARATDPRVQAHFAHAGLDPLRIVDTALADVVYRRGEETPPGDLNEDLFPRDEFRVAPARP